MDIFENIDYFLDSNLKRATLKWSLENALRKCVKTRLLKRPFRLVPYFDPGVLGWTMDERDIVALDPHDKITMLGVLMVFLKKTVLYFRFGDTRIEIPADGFGFVSTSRAVRNEKLLPLWC